MRTLNVTWVAWVFWNGKIVLVRGKNGEGEGEGEEERNYWGACVAYSNLSKLLILLLVLAFKFHDCWMDNWIICVVMKYCITIAVI
jgi:hypothetical protein